MSRSLNTVFYALDGTELARFSTECPDQLTDREVALYDVGIPPLFALRHGSLLIEWADAYLAADPEARWVSVNTGGPDGSAAYSIGIATEIGVRSLACDEKNAPDASPDELELVERFRAIVEAELTKPDPKPREGLVDVVESGSDTL